MENAGLRKSIEAGVYYFIVGQTRFFCERDLWKYAMLPLFFMVLFYLIFLGGTLMFICPRIAGFLAEGGRGLTGEHLPSLILHLFYGLAIFVIWATQNMLYQCFGAFIFDALSDCYEKRTFGYVYRHSLRRKCRANCESLLLSARNAVFGLGLLVLSILSFGVGAIICTLLTGYLLGVSYIQACAVNHGMGTRTLRTLARRHFLTISVFGTCSFLMQFVPFSSFLLTPGFIVGGCQLFWDNLCPEVIAKNHGRPQK